MDSSATNADIANQVIQIAKAYAIKMNEIENHISELQNSNTSGRTDFFAEFKALYHPVFQQYATSKKRVYGGQAESYGQPAKYDGIVAATIGQVNLKSASKAEVHFKTDNPFKAEYLFVLHKEGGDWKIDNVKYKWFNNEKWNPLIM